MVGMISTGDGIIIFLGYLLVIPAVTILQVLMYFACKTFKAKKKVCEIVSLLPAVLFTLWVLIYMLFLANSDVFEVAMRADKPSSVTELYTWQESFTDYAAEFYCEISPGDLKKIIKKIRI